MIVLHDYQAEASRWLAGRRRGVVSLAAGGGKTLVAASALDTVVRARPRERLVRVGWIANTREQVEQAHKAVAAYPVMLKMVDFRAACAAADTDWSDRDVIVVDEAHHAATAPQWQAQIQTCQGARWGLTATPPDAPEQAAALEQLLGEIFFVDRSRVSNITRAQVRWIRETDKNIRDSIDREIDDAMFKRRRYWHPQERAACERVLRDPAATPHRKREAEATLAGLEAQLWGQVAWQKCIELGIVNNRLRNDAAVATALRHRNNHVLMLVNTVEHGAELASRIPGALACHSKMGAKKRRAAMDAFRSGQCRCLIATTLADEGLDLPMADVLIMVSGGRSKARTEQRTGRVLRQFAGKSCGVIYDFTDDYHPLPAKHSRRREELYRSLGYEISAR